RCLKLLEMPNGLLPRRRRMGTTRPISGPATYHGNGWGTNCDIICHPAANSRDETGTSCRVCAATITRTAWTRIRPNVSRCLTIIAEALRFSQAHERL